MDNHQALVASTWDADQVALRDLVDGIVNINNTIAKDHHGNLDAFRAGAANIIQAEIEARRGDEHCSLSSFLAAIYEKLWLASYCPFKRHGAFQVAHPHHTRRPVVPVLFKEDMDAILETGKEQCLVQALCDFVTDNCLEPKYAPGALLNEQVTSQKSLQEEFTRQLQQKTAAKEKAPEPSTIKVAAVETEHEESHGDTKKSDSGNEDPEKEQKEIRVKWLLTLLKPAERGANGQKYNSNHGEAVEVLTDILSTDIRAYGRLAHLIAKIKETKEQRFYCARSFDNAQLPIEHVERRIFKCPICHKYPTRDGTLCLQFQSSSGKDGDPRIGYRTVRVSDPRALV